MAHFNLVATKANLNSQQSADEASESITLTVDMEGREQLTVNEDYLLASPHIFKIYGKDKKEVEAKLAIRRKSDFTAKATKKGGIGKVYFVKEYENEIDLLYFSASVWFEVHIEDKQYENIYNNIINKNYISEIWLMVEGEDLTYGFAPDGSEKIWNRKNENKTLTISNFNISFSNTENIEEESEEERSGRIIESLFKEIGQMKLYLAIVAIAAAIQILNRFFG